MNRLYRVTTRRTWLATRLYPKPFYVIAGSKDEAIAWVQANLRDGLVVSQAAYLGREISGNAFAKED
jgi:hypothetical protein